MSTNYGYISCKVDAYDQDKIVTKLWENIPELDAELTPDHVTVMYSDTTEAIEPLITTEAMMKDITILQATVIGVDVYGDEGSEYRAPVLLLESEDLEVIHWRAKQAGYIHSYDTYSPHLSLVYGLREKDIEIVLNAAKELIGSMIHLLPPEVELMKD